MLTQFSPGNTTHQHLGPSPKNPPSTGTSGIFLRGALTHSPWKAIPTFAIGVITHLFFPSFLLLHYLSKHSSHLPTFFFFFLGLFFLLPIFPFLFSFSSFPYPHLQGHLPSLPKHFAQFPELWLQGHLQPAHHNHGQALYKLTLRGWNAQGPRG